jgi:hypothetical protein
MIAPPRNIELLLASLGAERHFCDAVIGDLAEEFAHRAERDGLGTARRWYYREAVRAMPHLANNALRRLGMRGVLHRVGIAATAYTVVLMTTLTAAAIIGSVAAQLRHGAPLRTWHLSGSPWLSALATFGILAVDAAMAVFGGYLAAYLDADAPLFSAGMLGVSWVSVTLAVSAIAQAVGGPPTAPLAPLWLRCAAIVTVVGGSIAGGVIRIRARQPLHDEDLHRAGA